MLCRPKYYCLFYINFNFIITFVCIRLCKKSQSMLLWNVIGYVLVHNGNKDNLKFELYLSDRKTLCFMLLRKDAWSFLRMALKFLWDLALMLIVRFGCLDESSRKQQFLWIRNHIFLRGSFVHVMLIRKIGMCVANCLNNYFLNL